jgi:uncharacterized membrane protein
MLLHRPLLCRSCCAQSHVRSSRVWSMDDLAPERNTLQDQAALVARVEWLEAQVAALMRANPAEQRAEVPDVGHVPLKNEFEEQRSAPVVAPFSANLGAPRKSLEDELGTKVLSKIAVLLLLIGAAWFLKWAFDNRWIGPLGRVVAGLVAGVGVTLWSERFRRNGTPAFSFALKAVGAGVLYLSLWAAFQVYHLVPAPVALLAMIAVTAANGALAVAQDAEVLAGLALLGGYLTPVLLSSGGNHETFLFSYIFVLAAATVTLLRYKPWSRLLLGVFPAVVAYFIAWYAVYFKAAESTETLAFALLLWAVFAAVPFVAGPFVAGPFVAREREGLVVSIFTPLAAAAFGALSVYSVLADSGGRAWEPWFAAGFAAVYLGLARVRRRGVAAAVHISLAIVFLAVAVTLKATGRAISVGWLAEATALLWLAARAADVQETDARRAATAFRWLACGLLLLGTVGALAAPYLDRASGAAFFNRNFALIFGDVLALATAMYFARSFPDNVRLSGKVVATASFVALNIVLLVGMSREITHFFAGGAGSEFLRAPSERADFAFSGWMMLQGALLMVIGFTRRVALARWLGLLLLAATVIKAFAYDMRSLGTGYRVVSFLVLGMLLMAVSFAYQKDWLGLRDTTDEGKL